MKRQEFVDTRNEVYLDTMDAFRQGDIPPVLISSRSSCKPCTSWKDTVGIIQWRVRNRQDSKNKNSFHTSPVVSYKAYVGIIKPYYIKNIIKLDI